MSAQDPPPPDGPWYTGPAASGFGSTDPSAGGFTGPPAGGYQSAESTWPAPPPPGGFGAGRPAAPTGGVFGPGGGFSSAGPPVFALLHDGGFGPAPQAEGLTDERLAPPARPGRGLVVGLLAALVAGVAVIVVVAVVLGGPVEKTYVVSTPTQAGSYILDSSGGTAVAPVIDDERTAARESGARFDAIVAGFYVNPASSSFPPAGVVFVGGTGELGDPRAFVHRRRSVDGSPVTVTDTDAGGDGAATCTVAAGGASATCTWATASSFGTVTPTGPASAKDVAELMRAIRPDLEKPK